MRINSFTLVSFLFSVSTLAQEPKLMLPIGHTDPITYVEFSKDGKKAATASADKTAKIWDVETGRLLGELRGYRDEVTKIHFSPDGSRLISFTRSGGLNYFGTADEVEPCIRIWDAHTFKLIKALPRPEFTSSDHNFDPTFSSNSKWIVTIDRNKVCLWSAVSGNLLTSVIASEYDDLISAKFSPDGDKIVSASSNDRSVAVWGIDTTMVKGKVTVKKITEFLTPEYSVEWKNANYLKSSSLVAFFSSNGKYIITKDEFNVVQVYNAFTGKLIADINSQKDFIINVCANSSKPMYATTASDGTAKLWDSTGKLIYTLDQQEGQTGGDKVKAEKLYFSPDGTKLLVLSLDPKDNPLVKIWDVETGRLLTTFDSPQDDVTAAAFSFDGSKVLLAIDNIVRHNYKAVIHDLKSSGSTITLGGHTGSPDKIELSNDGSKFFTYSPEINSVSIWNAEESKILISFRVDSEKIAERIQHGIWAVNKDDSIIGVDSENSAKLFSKRVMHFNNDASMLIYTFNHDVQVYSTKSGLLISRFKIHEESISDFKIMADQKNMIAATFKTEGINLAIRIAQWEIATGKLLRTLYEFSQPLVTFNGKKLNFNLKIPELSHDNTMLLDFHTDNVIKVRDVQTGNILASVSPKSSSTIESAHFSPDNKKIIVASYYYRTNSLDSKDYEVNLWNIASGKISGGLKGPKMPPVDNAFFMPDSNRVFTVYNNDSRIWDSRTGTQLLKINSNIVGKVLVSKNGKRMVIYLNVISSEANRLELWDAEKGKLIKILEGHSGSIHSVLFTPNSDYIITTSEDKTLKKWNAKTGDLLFTTFIVDSTDYLVLDKDGRYDGSEVARKSLYFMCNDEMIDLEQFEKLCWEPGLVSKLQGLNKEPISAKKLSEISICNFTPEVESLGIVKGSYNYLINERMGGIGEVQLFANDKLIRTYKPGNLVKNGLHKYTLSVPATELERYFPSGASNRITVKATTKDNSMTSRGGDGEGPVIDKKKGNPNMYVVSIGINEYKGEGLKLHYASTDAENFDNVIMPAAQKLLNTDSLQHVKNYLFSTGATNPNKPFKKTIKERFDKIKDECTADDILVVFFAGHGVLQGTEKKFYLLTADAAAFNLTGVENEVAISFDELSEWMRNIAANKQVLIMDACNSGEAVDAQHLLGKREIPADLARAQENLKDQTGIFMLAASASGRPAFEASQFGQGLLTYSLLNGIKNQEAIHGNGFIDLTKWFSSAARNVSDLAREVGERQDPKIIGNKSFDIGLVNADILNSIKLPARKALFKQSQIKTLAMTDKLKLTQTVDSILNVHTAMGRESVLTFVESNKSTDAYSIRGTYNIENDKITVQITLIQGEDETGFHFPKTAAVNEVNTLGLAITEEIIGYLKKMKKN